MIISNDFHSKCVVVNTVWKSECGYSRLIKLSLFYQQFQEISWHVWYWYHFGLCFIWTPHDRFDLKIWFKKIKLMAFLLRFSVMQIQLCKKKIANCEWAVQLIIYYIIVIISVCESPWVGNNACYDRLNVLPVYTVIHNLNANRFKAHIIYIDKK